MKISTFVLIDSLNHQLHENNSSLHVDFTTDSLVLNAMQHVHFIHLQCSLQVDMNIMTLVVKKIHY